MGALVTGGSRGIGAAICVALAGAGHHVVSLDRDPPAQAGVETVLADLTDAAATAAAAADIAARHAVTCLVHNAGAIRPAVLAEATAEDLAALSQLHLGAALILAQAVLPAMRAAGSGRIVLVSSRAALGVPTRSAYGATKAGLIGLARTWALELAAERITVNVVAPGPIGGTAMFHELVPPGSDREAALARAIPVGRLGTPADVARAVLFFAAPEAGFITGQTLFVCGGASVGAIAI